MLTWTIDARGLAEAHYANFGRGRYSVTRSHGPRPYLARWHRYRDRENYSKLLGGAPTLEAAKEVCEHHAARIVGAIAMPFARLYDQHAEECVRSAEKAEDPKRRALLLQLADEWRRDADKLRQQAARK
jgi:hypothetical protein